MVPCSVAFNCKKKQTNEKVEGVKYYNSRARRQADAVLGFKYRIYYEYYNTHFTVGRRFVLKSKNAL